MKIMRRQDLIQIFEFVVRGNSYFFQDLKFFSCDIVRQSIKFLKGKYFYETFELRT